MLQLCRIKVPVFVWFCPYHGHQVAYLLTCFNCNSAKYVVQRTCVKSYSILNTQKSSLLGYWYKDSDQYRWSGLDLHVYIARKIYIDFTLHEKESSKVESSVKVLRQEVEKAKQEIGVFITPDKSTYVAPPKRSVWKKIGDGILHYYHGFRLLYIDIKVSSRLAWKLLHGKEMTRREHRQLVRTVSDVFRIVPFSVFIIVPFMELLLPVAIKLFPGMLPSTFETSSEREVKVKKQLKIKLEMAKFLQKTMDEMALHARGDKHSHSAKEFAQFFDKIQKSAEQPTIEEIMKFSKLFEDEITLDSLQRPQLVALCRLLELQPIGTNNFLRFQLKMQLRMLNADDQMIKKEGIETLTVSELQSACRARGMRALGVPEPRLRSNLGQWLELHLNERIPPSLLLLSRVLYLPENLPATDQLKATLSYLPDEAATKAKFKIGEKEGKVDNKTKIEVIEKEEVAIKKEIEEMKKEEEEKEHEAKARITALPSKKHMEMDEPVAFDAQGVQGIPEEAAPVLSGQEKPSLVDVIQDTSPVFDTREEELDQAKQSIIERLKFEELSKDDFADLEDALENIANEKRKLLLEKEELEELKEEMADYKEDIEEFHEVILKRGDTNLQESKAAKHLFNKVNNMITKMDLVLAELAKERNSLQQHIEDMAQKGENVQQERDDIININDLVLAIRRIQKVSDDIRLQKIVDVLDQMDIDHDGAVEIYHVMKVIELVGKDNVKVGGSQMREIIELLVKEEILQKAEREEKGKKQKPELETKIQE
ncbi:mitochondrial proton/calcium exchanger protein-like [Limulus polyphemus]|uniref:Mitochondrial proton/calcium exchanger protein-like n=1 Tax=Limulus polyphemus TaxID=6850 RepID=A0ABM1B2Z0_LIMPO|nr:mitochondrial proton/calcium exchanger protein-like [Limulus polyphemus]XP_022240760.1 mitochondrial proton/calcium exchanger protein-like [Limulus polyphemus]